MSKIALKSLSWMTFGQLSRTVISVLVTIALARYIGVQGYGALSFALVVVGMAKVGITLGMQNIVIRGILEGGDWKNLVFNSIFLQILAALVALIVVLGATYLLIENSESRTLIYILSISLLLQPLQVIAYKFEATLDQKFISISLLVGSLVGGAAKVGAIYLQANMATIVFLFLLEYAVSTFILIVFYYRSNQKIFSGVLDTSLLKKILSDSWPYFLGSFAVMLYTYTDTIMINYFLSLDRLGNYAIAARLSDMWHILPIAITSTALPFLFSEKQNKSSSGEIDSFQRLHNIMVYISYTWILIVFCIGTPTILVVFGDSYVGATQVILPFSFISLFYALGVASSKWYLLEGLQKMTLWRNLFGASVNILLNIYLIPEFGIQGAAYGTLLAFLSANYLYDLFDSRTRNLFMVKTKSLFLVFLFSDAILLKKWFGDRRKKN